MASGEVSRAQNGSRLTRTGGGVSAGWLGIFGLLQVEGCPQALGTISTVWAGPLILRMGEDRAAGLLRVQHAVSSPLVLDKGGEKRAGHEARCQKRLPQSSKQREGR